MFSGKVALVTGGASGQGLEACTLFAQKGAKVVIADVDGEKSQALAQSIGAFACTVDISSEASVIEMMEQVKARFGRLDILFNNAGIGFSANSRYKMASVVDTPEEAWDGILAINLKGPGLVCRHAIPLMVESGGGSIINNSSINGIVGVSGADAYTASKGGLIALTRALAVDWAKSGIRVNCICPGPIDTPMIADAMQQEGFSTHFESMIPLGRIGLAREVANVAVFLASDEASYLTGAIIPVDGGMSAH